MADPLRDFKPWEGEELGPDRVEPKPGWVGKRRAPRVFLHIAGAWGESTAMGREGDRPAVYLRMVAGAAGTGPRYHVIDGVVEADIAEQWGRLLIEAAQAARRDVAVERGRRKRRARGSKE